MSSTPSIFRIWFLIASIDIFLGVFSKNKSSASFRFFTAFIKIKIAIPIDISGSINEKPVSFITIVPTSTTAQPSTSSSIWRLTAFWFNESPSLVKYVAKKFTTIPIIAKNNIPL